MTIKILPYVHNSKRKLERCKKNLNGRRNGKLQSRIASSLCKMLERIRNPEIACYRRANIVKCRSMKRNIDSQTNVDI